jgi:hypothetical protein
MPCDPICKMQQKSHLQAHSKTPHPQWGLRCLLSTGVASSRERGVEGGRGCSYLQVGLKGENLIPTATTLLA